MRINVQYVEAAELLFELLQRLPESEKAQYADRVDATASELCHPSLCGDVLCAFSSGDTGVEKTH